MTRTHTLIVTTGLIALVTLVGTSRADELPGPASAAAERREVQRPRDLRIAPQAFRAVDGAVEVAQNERTDTEPLAVEEVVARVQAFYDDVQAYHADFQQVYSNVALADDEVTTGHMYFLKPGRMRWDYVAPMEKYLVSDGETVWIYEPEFNQVVTMGLSTTELPSALRFLMGEGVLVDDFRISLVECDMEQAYCLHLVSRTGEGDYQYLEFVVDAVSFSIRQTEVVDPIGNINRFIFSNASTTDIIPVETFDFVPPEDARIIHQ